MYANTRRVCTLALAFALALGCSPTDSDGESSDNPIQIDPTGEGDMMGAGGSDDVIPVSPGGEDDGDTEPDPQVDSDDGPNLPNVNGPGGGDPAPSPPPMGACDQNGFQPSVTSAGMEQFGLQYTAEGGQPAGSERFWVQIYSGFNGPTQPGRYTVENENFADCGLCLLIFSGCNGQTCAKTFYADNATVNITELGGPGGRFAATVESAVFKEVTIESETYRSVPVAGGETWCVGDYAFDEAIAEGMAPPSPPPGNGGMPNNPDICGQPGVNCVGDTVPDFELLNCESGEMENIAGADGDRAVWLVMTAGWCPACSDWLTQISMIANDPEAQGIKFVFVFGENRSRLQPSIRECQQYARQYGGAANFYIDHDGEDSFRTTFTNMWPYLGPNGEFGLPWNGLLNAQNREYVHGDNAGTDLRDALLSLLQ